MPDLAFTTQYPLLYVLPSVFVYETELEPASGVEWKRGRRAVKQGNAV